MINKSLFKKFAKFGGVGVINTIIDYLLFNILIISFGLKPFVANLFSTSCALIFSYFMNKRFVFEHEGRFDVKSAGLFLGFTLFGLWIIQGIGLSIIIHLTQKIAPDLYSAHPFIINNLAKLIASIASIFWNFVTYNKIVFKQSNNSNADC